jgi:hypothetical protein
MRSDQTLPPSSWCGGRISTNSNEPGRPTIERFFIDHNSRNAESIAKRLDQIRKAVPATTDVAVLTSCAAAIVAWAGLLKQLLAAITAYDEKIDVLARQHPDYTLMKSLPGAGPALAPRLNRRSWQPARSIRDCV